MKKVLICFIFLFGIVGCSKKKFVYNEEIDNSFTEYIDDYTRSSFSNSPMEANFYFLNPELFGIENKGYNGMNITEPNKKEIKNLIKEIEDFDYYSLSYKNRLTYEVLLDSLEMELEMVDYYYYETSLGSYLGYQAQLPMLLYLYRFDDVSDIENYFTYLEKTEDDFRQIVNFEVERIDKNLALASSVLEGTIEQCESVYTTTDYFLATTFDDRIEELNLSNESDLIARNNTLVRKFQDAYKTLADEIKDKLLSQINENTINGYKNGTKYYELLVKKATGSDKNISQIKYDLENAINELSRKITYSNNEIITNDDYSTVLSSYIKSDNLWNDFPKIKTSGNDYVFNYDLDVIDKSMEDYFSPAAYLTSPLDGAKIEKIVINEKQIEEQIDYNSSYIYSVMAHEGVPGHMYQNLYFKTSSNYNYLRGLLDCIGYTEGWATYVQYYALKYTGLDSSSYQDLIYMELISGYITCYLDIQINYYGWKKEHVVNYLVSSGNSEELANAIYDQLVEVPTNAMQYYYGYLQFEQLKTKAKKELGKNYSDLIFHTFVLDMGSMPFYILEDHIEDINNYVK